MKLDIYSMDINSGYSFCQSKNIHHLSLALLLKKFGLYVQLLSHSQEGNIPFILDWSYLERQKVFIIS